VSTIDASKTNHLTQVGVVCTGDRTTVAGQSAPVICIRPSINAAISGSVPCQAAPTAVCTAQTISEATASSTAQLTANQNVGPSSKDSSHETKNTAGDNHLTQVNSIRMPDQYSTLELESRRILKELRIAHEQRDRDQETLRRAQSTAENAILAAETATKERSAALHGQRILEDTVKQMIAQQEKVTGELEQQRRAMINQQESHADMVEKLRQEQTKSSAHFNQTLKQYREHSEKQLCQLVCRRTKAQTVLWNQLRPII